MIEEDYTNMPSSVTHSYFTQDVYNNLDENIKTKLKNNIEDMKVFGQGPDPYFFYDFHLTRRSKEIFKINAAMHHSKVNEHFISIIKYINDKDYYDNAQVISYLYGQICHFVLDSCTHPYTIYNTGVYDEKDSKTYKYNGKHAEMEYYIDIYLISEREKIAPRKYKVYKNIFNLHKFNNELRDVIDTVISNVYGFNNVSAIYYKSIMDMRKFYHVFNYDRIGIKKIIYKIMDFICRDKVVKKEELSFFVLPNSKNYLLNKDKSVWYNPCNKKEKYDFSFEELYDMSICKAVNIIHNVDKMLYTKRIEESQLKKLFGNLDYATGKDCNLNLKFKCFKF